MKSVKRQYNAGLLNEAYCQGKEKKIELIESVIDYSRDFNLIILVGVL
jgi:hypothetical protein